MIVQATDMTITHHLCRVIRVMSLGMAMIDTVQVHSVTSCAVLGIARDVSKKVRPGVKLRG